MLSSPRKEFWFIATSIAAALGIIAYIVLNSFPQYNRLLVLFLYAIPAEFVIAILPHEPIIIYFGKSFSPFTVAWVSVMGTLFIEASNYMLVTLCFKIPKLDELRNHDIFQKVSKYFLKAPFISLVVAAFSPVPFYPFRIIAPTSGYPMKRYLSATFLGRAPRFYILAYFGHTVEIPNKVIGLLFVILLVLSISQYVKRLRKRQLLRKTLD